jgi:multidrug resistance efflux pump
VSSLQLSGTVSAVTETQLSFGAKGTIDQVLVSPGQTVRSGDTLATLDTRDLQQKISDTQSALQISNLRLQQLQQQTAAQAQAQQQLLAQQQADAAKQSQLNQQKTSDAIAQAQEQLRVAQQNFALVQAGAAQSDRLAAQAAVVTASGTLAKAQADLAQLQASPTSAELSAAQQAVSTAQTALAKAQSDRDKLLQPPDPAVVAAAKKDLADAQSDVVALNNPVVSKTAGSSAPQISDAERQSRLQAAQLAVTAAQAKLTAVQKTPDASTVQLANMAVDNAKSDLAAVQARLETVKAGPTQVQFAAAANAIEVAQVALSGAQAHQQEVNSHPTPGELADAQSKLDQAQQALDRASQPADGGTSSSFSSAGSLASSMSVGGTGNGDSVQIQTLQLQHTAEQQQAQLQTLREQLAASAVRAPFDGIVETVQLRPGDPSDPQKPGVVLASNGAPVLVANVADGDVDHLKTAGGISVQLDASTTANGTISAINANPGGSGQLAQIQVDWPAATVPALGATLQVNVAVEQHKGVVIVPQKAVRASGDRRSVEVLDGVDRKQVDVSVGIVSGDDAEIASGLREGQIVVLPA